MLGERSSRRDEHTFLQVQRQVRNKGCNFERGEKTAQVHKPNPKGKNQRDATDPVTGKEVVIEDATKEMYKYVQNPTLSVPNANLGKDTVS